MTEVVNDVNGAEWDSYVESAPHATVYHRYAWRSVIRDVFEHETHYLALRNQPNALAGVLPLVRLSSRLFGDFLVSMPFFNYGGILADSARDARALADAAARYARELGVSHVELRHAANQLPDWPSRTDKVAMVLDLPGSVEQLHSTLSSKVRAQIKRPLREGARCRSGGAELLEDFYRVFSRNMRDLGTPVYSLRFFRAMVERLKADCRIFVVRLGEEPVAAAFTIGYGGTLEIPWASSLRSANPLGVNMLLYWSALEYACSKTYRRFDFGRCTADSGTYRFKRQWGAEPVQLYWHYWLRAGGELPALNHANPKYRFAIAAWQRLPVPIANLLGPLIVRSLP